MKKTIFAVALIALMSTSVVMACPGGKYIDRMIDKLELSSEQEAEVRDIMEIRFEEMLDFRAEQKEKTREQLSEILTAEQFAELEELMQRRHKKHRGI